MTIDPTDFPVTCTGDACVGDIILFSEAVFGGSFRRPQHLGERRIVARIVRDSYGVGRQQHTFSLEVIASDGVEALAAGRVTLRKGRNVYRAGTSRQRWTDEAARQAALDEKHGRGDRARAIRDARRSMPIWMEG